MAIANTTIQIKKSVVSGNTPGSLANGEIAINTADGKLFYRTPSGTIGSIQAAQSFATVNANSSLVLASSSSDTLSIIGSNGISITANTTSKTITVGDGTTYNLATSKTQTYYQNTAPSTPNANDCWLANTGVMYENFGNTSYPVWAEVGPTGLLTNTAPGTLTGTSLVVTGLSNITYTPATTVGAGLQISAANTKGGTGYADFLQVTNVSGGATNPNKYFRLSTGGVLEIIDSGYANGLLTLNDVGDLVIKGNTTSNGIAPGYAPNRPGFRVYGGNTTNINATTTLSQSNWVLDWQQGSYLNQSTGIFTAPVAGLYSVNLTARTQTNSYAGTSAITVQKTTGGTTTNVCYVEFYNNTSMNHAGSSTIVKLAVGDTLKVVVTSGQITFDLNDNWAVAYLG